MAAWQIKIIRDRLKNFSYKDYGDYDEHEDFNEPLYEIRKCENCGSNDLTNEDGVLTCQSCGSKFATNISKIKSSEDTSKDNCYIATSVYGSYDSPEVHTLRLYKNYTLSKSWHGKLFIKIYYKVSPSIVKYFGNTKIFKFVFKKILDEFVTKLQKEKMKIINEKY